MGPVFPRGRTESSLLQTRRGRPSLSVWPMVVTSTTRCWTTFRGFLRALQTPVNQERSREAGIVPLVKMPHNMRAYRSLLEWRVISWWR
jgi:hypothetical protein